MSTRKDLTEARMRRGWSQEDLAEKLGVHRNTVSEWERGVKAPYPTHVKALCELYGMTSEELGLHSNHATNLLIHEGSIEDILGQCAAGIAACHELSYRRDTHNNIALATQIIESYVPILKALLPSQRAAYLLSRVYQMRRGNAYHLETTSQALMYGNEAVRFARISQDAAILAMTLHELASVYEWPLPGLQLRERHKKALEHIEEAVHIQEKRGSTVPAPLQGWNYIGQAKFQALNGLKQDAYTSISKAYDAFKNATGQEDDFIVKNGNKANLMRQESIAYSYLHEQAKAITAFLRLIDVNNEHMEPTIAMPDRTHVSLLSEAMISSFRLPTTKKDKDLSVKLWRAELGKALLLRSTTYFNEAKSGLDIMEAVWPDDAEVADLRDLLVPWQ